MTAATPISFEEFERLEFGADHVELLEGDLIRLPPPQRRHMERCERLFERLKGALMAIKQREPGRKFGTAHMEMGYLVETAPKSWLRPDVSVTWPEQAGDRYYEGAPQLVFEIVSDSETAAQIEGKIRAYLKHGAAEVWMFYPEGRAWVYTESSARLETVAITSPHLPGISIPFADFF